MDPEDLAFNRSEQEIQNDVWKMWNMVERGICSALHRGRLSLGTRRTLGAVLWPGRSAIGPAFNARRRTEARLRTDEGTGDEIWRHLQSQCRSDLPSAPATGR